MYKICSFCKIKFKTWDNAQKFCSKRCSAENYKLKYSGKQSPNYGVKKTSLAKERIRKAKLGAKNPAFGKSSWNKGLSWPEYIKTKISATKKELIQKGEIVPWNKGKKNVQTAWNKGLNKSLDNRIGLLAAKLSAAKIKLLNDPVKSLEYRNKLSRVHKTLYSQNPEERLRLIKARAKIVYPKKNTSIEIKIQQALLRMGIKYVTNFPFYNNLCETRIDIAIPNKKIAIFCDGDYWHNLPGYPERDKKITNGLINSGWKVVRFWEHEINTDISKCTDKIVQTMGGQLC